MTIQLTTAQQGEVDTARASMDQSFKFNMEIMLLQNENSRKMAMVHAMKSAADKIRA
jgi:hypothetical protein